MIKKVFKYLEPMWLGHDKQISIRRILAIIFSFDIIYNLHSVIEAFTVNSTFGDAAMIIGIEAGLIAALLSLTTYSSISGKKS